MTVADLLSGLLWVAAGAALGTVYFALVGRSVAALMDGGARGAALWLGLRLALAAGAFWVAATQGALPAVAMLGGFLAARSVVIARARRA
jgi:hypothetical protein